MRESPKLSEQIFQRLLELLVRNDEPQYAHPNDIQLSCYLYVLLSTQPDMAEKAAKQMIGVQNLFWARDFAEEILSATTDPIHL